MQSSGPLEPFTATADMTPPVPERYDPATLFHWLWWRVRCLEASPQEFQQLFEKVASKVRPDFMKVRPYGRLGDRKCDGLYWGDGIVFQVYSPDELRQAETLAKVQEDLAGAVAEWGDHLVRWIFVYNTRRGLAPDIPRLLKDQQRYYPGVEIEPLSDEALWGLMRTGLSLQQRAEVLGAPSSYEHIFLLPGAVPEEIASSLRRGRFVVVHDVLSPINIRDVAEALKPEQAFGPPFYIRPSVAEESWEMAVDLQRELVVDALRRSRDLLPRFAVFSLAPIPLAVHLGYLFSDRVEVRPFQYDRDRKTWCWDDSVTDYDTAFKVDGVPTGYVDGTVEAVVRVSLSATISADDTTAISGDCPIQIDLRLDSPDVMWLRHPKQLTTLGSTFRQVLRDLRRMVAGCERIHLFYAGPTGGAVVLGQAINPRMTPEVALYEYDRRQIPRYRRVITLR